MIPVFKNVGKRCVTKNYRSVSLVFVVSKVVEKRAKRIGLLIT